MRLEAHTLPLMHLHSFPHLLPQTCQQRWLARKEFCFPRKLGRVSLKVVMLDINMAYIMNDYGATINIVVVQCRQFC